MSEIKGLGYVRVLATDMDRWRELGFDVLGFAPGFGEEEDALHFRMDERPSRITVERADVDRVSAVGWELRDGPALARLEATLRDAGYEYTPMSQELADRRKVEAGICMTDPGGTPLEFFHGPVLEHSPVVTEYAQRFVTGAQGLGHVVMPTANFEESYTFYTETLGFLSRGAFRMPAPPGAGPLRIRFLGVNQRHHSLAIMPALEGRDPGLIHVMVEVDSLDAVGQALDQVMARDFPVSSTLGRHTNDKMVSFYVGVPGGWDIEYGTAGELVDESYYTAEEITAADARLSVLVVEKSEYVGGSTARSGAAFLEHGPAAVEMLARTTPMKFMWAEGYSDGCRRDDRAGIGFRLYRSEDGCGTSSFQGRWT